MKLSDQLEISSQNFVKEMYQTPIFRNHIWYPSIFINKSYLPFRPMLPKHAWFPPPLPNKCSSRKDKYSGINVWASYTNVETFKTSLHSFIEE